MADQDLDDELLALAGGGSEDDAAVDVKPSIEDPSSVQQSSLQPHAHTNGAPTLRGGEGGQA